MIRKRSGITYFFDRGPLESLAVFYDNRGTHFEIHSEAALAKDATLTEWKAFGADANLAGFDQILTANINAKGRLTTGVFDKMRLGDQFGEFTHAMGIGKPSWFFPLPVNYIFAAYYKLLFLGHDNIHDFSQWTLSARDRNINRWSLVYGNHLKFRAGQKISSPRWIGFFMDADDPFAPWPVYTKILRQKGRFKNSHHERPSWWANLNYVTWGDQHVYKNGEKTATYRQTETNLSEETVRRWIGIIEKHHLPFRTITIDGYWCPRIGDWHADEKRFADMRLLVDELHGRGYKVIFWYCPFEADREADVFRTHPEFFLEEKDGQELFLEKDIKVETRPRYDYTRPDVREFIREDIRRMLSSARDVTTRTD
ncbi:MAG: glycoside hydrolase family 31 protein [Verrucomicrobiae bacterium]|nr:glycoside hydrolase family 31 protein [Verrucomicrobiae bacterium]